MQNAADDPECEIVMIIAGCPIDDHIMKVMLSVLWEVYLHDEITWNACNLDEKNAEEVMKK